MIDKAIMVIALGLAVFAISEKAAATERVPETLPPPEPENDGSANIAAFLAMIRHVESGDNYNALYGGDVFTDFSDHPRIKREAGGITSTAAGAYQILEKTWDTVIQPALHLPDFSPASQDRAALFLITRRGALPDIKAGNFSAAVSKVAKEWASLPGAGYGQHENGIDSLVTIYTRNGGVVA